MPVHLADIARLPERLPPPLAPASGRLPAPTRAVAPEAGVPARGEEHYGTLIASDDERERLGSRYAERAGLVGPESDRTGRALRAYREVADNQDRGYLRDVLGLDVYA